MRYLITYSKYENYKKLKNNNMTYEEIKDFCENNKFLVYKFIYENTNVEILKNKKNEITVIIDNEVDILRNLPLNTKILKIYIYNYFYNDFFDNLPTNLNKIIFINTYVYVGYDYLLDIKKIPFGCVIYTMIDNIKYKVKNINNEILLKEKTKYKKLEEHALKFDFQNIKSAYTLTNFLF